MVWGGCVYLRVRVEATANQAAEKLPTSQQKPQESGSLLFRMDGSSFCWTPQMAFLSWLSLKMEPSEKTSPHGQTVTVQPEQARFPARIVNIPKRLSRCCKGRSRYVFPRVSWCGHAAIGNLQKCFFASSELHTSGEAVKRA